MGGGGGKSITVGDPLGLPPDVGDPLGFPPGTGGGGVKLGMGGEKQMSSDDVGLGDFEGLAGFRGLSCRGGGLGAKERYFTVNSTNLLGLKFS